MQNLPVYISLVFVLTVLFLLLIFYVAVRKSALPGAGKLSVLLAGLGFLWLAAQAVLARKGLYTSYPDALPPKIVLFGVAPALTVVALAFILPAGRRFADALSLSRLTWLHVVRVPVELVLFRLCLYGAVPESMTFEGQNFDILSGISAPFVAYYGFAGGKIRRGLLIVWNLVCLALLANIVATAFLSAPSPLQRLAFDQPNVAILYFPFVWLPTFVVPVVLFAHLASLRQLFRQHGATATTAMA